jgi:transposase
MGIGMESNNMGFSKKCVYLPAYSPELSPIEQSRAFTKAEARRFLFIDNIF